MGLADDTAVDVISVGEGVGVVVRLDAAEET